MTTTTTARRDYRLGEDISTTTRLDEALTAAGLNWDLRLIPATNFSIITDDGDVLISSMANRRFVVRTDNGLSLNTVGIKYEKVSNRDAFALGQAWLEQGAVPARAGEIDGGCRTFMEFDFPEHRVDVGGKDLVSFGGRIIANHDGSGKVRAKIVGRRLWCMNGCTVAMKGIAHEFAVSHTASAQERLAQGAAIMQEAGRYVEAFSGAAAHLAATPMSRAQFGRYVDVIFPRPEEGSSKNRMTSWENRRDELFEVWQFSETNAALGETRWVGFNAVTEWLDWSSDVRQGTIASSLEEARALRQFDDVNEETRNAAWAYVLAA
jgi:phage/plasmid-like protein (TIGR03299 family)